MREIAALTLFALMFGALSAEEWRLKVISSDEAETGNVEGSAAPVFRPADASPSPDGTRVAYVSNADGDAEIFVARTDGSEQRRLTDNETIDSTPVWTKDGKRIVFASTRSGKWQVYSMDLDGADIKQLTDHKVGAWWPSVGPNGQIAFLAKYASRKKYRPVDLCLLRGEKTEALAKNTFIADYSWSPDGARIAYSSIGKLVFHDLKTAKTTEVSFSAMDEKLSWHGAHFISWRPDSLAVACRVSFLGGRAQGAEMFGDHEIFIIPVEGKSSWFRPEGPFERVEWVR